LSGVRLIEHAYDQTIPEDKKIPELINSVFDIWPHVYKPADQQ